MEYTIWSLVPPVLAIVMVLLTRRVILSLGVGIIASALFITKFHVIDSSVLVWDSFKVIFIEDGSLNTWNVYILLFVLTLGILTAFMSMMGGTHAFGDWMISKVKTRKGAQLMTMLLGIIIFIDDYFNSLTVGPISRPVTDRHRISRAKLAYIVDSTAAPVSVVAPISSWGAYIIGLIGSVLVTLNVTNYTAIEAFLKMIPMNFYVWAALGTVFVIIISQADFGPMKRHEQRAQQMDEAIHSNHPEIDVEADLPRSESGTLKDLLLPIGTLFIATVAIMYWSGYVAAEQKTLINILGEADVSLSLLCGGVVGLLVTFYLFLNHNRQGKLTSKDFSLGLVQGIQSMLSAIGILLFAWSIAHLIGVLETGEYLGSIVAEANMNLAFLPVVVFLIAGFIAFSTGTSWGSFAILLPIAGQIAGATDINLLLPSLAAVLAGAVFGDHCSPISDTTILSSTGAGCHHIDHVTTQLPYAIVSAIIAGVGYIVLGFTGNVWLGLGTVFICLIIFFGLLKSTKNDETNTIPSL